MIEVEAKIKISSPEKFRRNIKKLAKFMGKENKIDSYYTLENVKNYPGKSLRIRKRKGVYEINFKQRLSYVKGIHAKNEHEFKLKNITPFLDLIKEFGFKKWLIKEKISEIYRINNNFHIELNLVKHLGWFIEIEYLTDKKGISNARDKILYIINKLGIDSDDIIKEGYTKLLWKERKLSL